MLLLLFRQVWHRQPLLLLLLLLLSLMLLLLQLLLFTLLFDVASTERGLTLYCFLVRSKDYGRRPDYAGVWETCGMREWLQVRQRLLMLLLGELLLLSLLLLLCLRLWWSLLLLLLLLLLLIGWTSLQEIRAIRYGLHRKRGLGRLQYLTREKIK